MKSFATFALFFLVLLSLSSSFCAATKTTTSRLRGSGENKRNHLLKRVLKKGSGKNTGSTSNTDLSLCPFDTKGMENMVALANNGTVQLNDCSCSGYDDTATTNLRMDYTVYETFLDTNGTAVQGQVQAWIAFGASIGSFGYEYQIDDILFPTEEDVYGACLQLLRNQCGDLDAGEEGEGR